MTRVSSGRMVSVMFGGRRLHRGRWVDGTRAAGRGYGAARPGARLRSGPLGSHRPEESVRGQRSQVERVAPTLEARSIAQSNRETAACASSRPAPSPRWWSRPGSHDTLGLNGANNPDGLCR